MTEQARRWIDRELYSIRLRDISRLLFHFVDGGGEIEEVVETRPQWRDRYEYHYDLRMPIYGKIVYIETRLNYRLPVVADESWILVVNIHEP